MGHGYYTLSLPLMIALQCVQFATHNFEEEFALRLNFIIMILWQFGKRDCLQDSFLGYKVSPGTNCTENKVHASILYT